MNIPLWFVRLATGLMTLAVPWAAWVTVQLVAIGVRLETLVELRTTVDRLQTRLTDHVTGPESHAHEFRELTRRLDRLEKE